MRTYPVLSKVSGVMRVIHVTELTFVHFALTHYEELDLNDLRGIAQFDEHARNAGLIIDSAKAVVWGVKREYLSMLRTSLKMVQMGFSPVAGLLLQYRGKR